MSKSEIQSWISTATAGESSNNDEEQVWQRERVLNDWPWSLEYAQKVLLKEKAKERTRFLREELLSLAKHGELSLSQILDVFKLLTLTYPRYADSSSQDAVEAVGMELVRRDELRGTADGAQDEAKFGVAEQIIGWLSNEIGKLAKRGNADSYAPSDLFVLSSWSCGLYTVCVKHDPHFTSSNASRALIGSLALVLDMLAESSKAKPSLKRGAVVRARRALRSAGKKVPDVISTLLSISKTNPTPAKMVELLGIAVSVLIRLKHEPVEPVARLSPELKEGIISLYSSVIFMAKSSLPLHTLVALNDFISTFVTVDDFTQTISPTIEKALLRSPEYSLSAVTQFFSAYTQPLPLDSFQRLLTQIISSAKSTNAIVRANSVNLFKVLVERNDPADTHNLARAAVPELVNLPKAGKSAGPDHRIALYTMLSALTPAPGVSLPIVQAITTLIAKEPHEGAATILAAALAPNVVYLLHEESVPPETVQLISKEMNSAKVPVRKAFVGLAGSIFFDDQSVLEKDSGLALAKALFASFETCLKTVATNPLSSSGGPYEGYVALAILLGPFAKSKKFDAAISSNAAVSGVTSGGVKQSFLLWDKVYQKLTTEEDERWLLRAADVALQYFANDLAKNEALRSQFGLIYAHLALESQFPEIRRLTNASIIEAVARSPKLTGRIIREALSNLAARDPQAKSAMPTAIEESSPTRSKQGRLSVLLLSTVTFAEDVDITLRENAAVELVVLAHHQLICGSDRQTWIDICQRARVDPYELIEKRLDDLISLMLDATLAKSKFGYADASYGAVTTLTFIAPAAVLPRIVDQLKDDLNPEVLNSISDDDLAIWATPEGTTFVDVLSSSQAEVRPNKGKDYEIAKWEEEIRKSLASKKSTPATLSKQQQALVQVQLEKESKIRKHVNDVQARLIRGLNFVKSLVAAGVEEFQSHMSDIVSLLLKGALGRGSFLAGSTAFETYVDLSIVTSDRLDTFRRWIGIATLRYLQIGSVPEELQAEPLYMLVLRVFYRLRTLSEQAPFDAATFSYTTPLISQTLLTGGLPGLQEEDDPMEQVALALEIIKYHSGEFANPAFPRLQIIENLIHVIRGQPNLAKEASSDLIGIGEAIHTNALPAEISALLRGTLFQESYVRNSCLQALQPFDLTDMDWSPELWIACHDDDEQNARLAVHVWEDNGLDVPETFLKDLLDYLGHDNAYVRSSTAAAIAEAVEQWPQTIHNTLSTLEDYYRDKAKVLAPEFDQYGMVIAQSLDRSDPWHARLAVSTAFELLAPSFAESELEPFFAFLIEDQALGDRISDVRRGMLCAGTAVIDLHGASRLASLISVFEARLGTTSSSGSSETDDQIKEAVVILFGRVARHLQASDPRIPTIVDRLVDALKTPAEQVQIAVSECLSPLVTLMRPRLPTLVDGLFHDLFEAPKYASRRGAAYGLAGVIKGTGIGGMKEFNVIPRLKAAAEEKKRYEFRQGVMFAFETLSNTLGRLFEPYITYVLPLLLASFGDTTADVREATQEASRVIMGNLSGYGVKLILPTLLEGLDEKQWRSKKGSIELLGMMAYCSPRQLSISLPIVIPRLTGVLTDSHAQVRTAANKSLKQFGEVISNPEIQSLVPVLLKALVDPAKTPNALSALLKMSFMHYIDHSSLALVVPILERGLRERGADTKRKAAQIVGNLASLTDTKDFVPYLDELLPMVHLVLVDPVPEARATAAKALGTLVERLGEVHFPDLVPGLLRTLKTDTSGVDRQGAAQGLSEVLSGLGMERLEGLLPDIIANARSPRPTVREGFMSLLVYLPATFGSRFQPHLPKIIAPILGGLSDTEEYVREAAMRAGRMVVNNYSSKAIDLLLPELENGMFDPGWRIRQSSITLVGELLFKVSGISGKASEFDEEDVAPEATTAESSRRALLEVLGAERRDRILAALYLVRQDGVVVVRQASIQIWKALVHNTPRTVREILPELVDQILSLISSDEFEQQETAARTVAEICRKFGERILGEIMPILKTKATSLDSRTREGVCSFISEIMQNSTEPQREDHEDDIIAIVRAALVDDESNVRSAAAQAFDVLQEEMGTTAIDQTIPTLLEALRQPGKGSGTALQALKEVMNVRASTVFPVLIPTLTAIPMSVFNARALASLVTVAGNALSRRLTVILNALVKVSEDKIDDELREAVDEAIQALFSSVSDAEGLNTVMMMLIGWAKNDSPTRRVSACKLFTVFCEFSELDSSLYRIDWIRQLVSLLDDPQVPVHTAAWNAFDSFVRSVPKDELEPLVVPLRRTIDSTGAPGRTVPGFDLPKGVAPTVPIIIAGLTTGSNEQREQAAYAIGDLVARTSESAIKAFVVPFTGPLIRVATQAAAYPPGVKIAILSALTEMLARIPAFVKPFFPQLQRTFVKSTGDPGSAAVRAKAAQALGVLMRSQPRVDPVVTELVAAVRANEEAVAASFVLALTHVLRSAASNVGEKAAEAVAEVVSDAFSEAHGENYCAAIGGLVRALTFRAELLRPVVESHLVYGTPPSVISSYVILGAVSLVDEDEDETDEGPNVFQRLGLMRSVAQKVLESAASDKPFISRPAREARDRIRDLDDDELVGLF